jgi:hypothetical protein
LGEQWDEENDPTERKKTLSVEEATKRITPILAEAKTEYADAEKWLKDYLAAEDGEEEEECAGATEEPETVKAEVTPEDKEVAAKDVKRPVELDAKVPVPVKS